jgi:hypothetical protein
MCWADYLSTLPKDTRLTWNQFKVAFHGYHIPAGLIEVKTTEFLKVEQGTRTVIEYMHSFNHLSRYAPSHVDTEEKCMYYFMRGLSLNLQTCLAIAKCATYNELVSDAIFLENKVRLHRKTRSTRNLL